MVSNPRLLTTKSTPLEKVFWDTTVLQCIKGNTSLSPVLRISNPLHFSLMRIRTL